MNEANNKSRAFNATIWFFICSVIQKSLSIITTPIFTRLMSTGEYGQYNVFNSWMGIVGVFVSLRLSYGMYAQGLVKFDADKRCFSSSVQLLGMLLTILWVGGYYLFRDFINSIMGLSTSQVVAMLLLIWTTSLFEFWSSEQKTNGRYKGLLFITILYSLLRPLVCIFFVVNSGDKVSARINGTLLVELICFGWMFVRCFFGVDRSRMTFYWRYAIRFCVPLIPHYLSQTILNSTDRIMIKAQRNQTDSGIYSLAYSVSQMMLIINVALSGAIGPWFYRKIKVRDFDSIEKVTYITLIFVAICNLIMIGCAPEIISIFAPLEYAEAMNVVPLVSMSVFFLYEYEVFSKFEFFYEKTMKIMIASILVAIINVILNYYCINLFGYVAAGFTTLLCYILYAVLHYIFMNNIKEMRADNLKVYNLKKIMHISGVFILVGFGFFALYDTVLLRYVCVSLLVCYMMFFVLKNRKILSSLLSE